MPHQADASEAHRRIHDLEAQVKLLNSKAAAAVDKLADYEDEVRFLRAAYSRATPPTQSQLQDQNESVNTQPSSVIPNAAAPAQSKLATLTSFIPSLRSPSTPLPQTPGLQTGSNSLSPPSNSRNGGANRSTPNLVISGQEEDSDNATRHQSLTLLSLQSSLETERTLRLRAETNLTQTQTELEELTAQLFGQANEMVAQERKARAKLEERVKVLEMRDVEKRRRLDRLEKALERIERVRKMIK